MAAPELSWQQVLDDADDATAQLILHLSLEDTEEGADADPSMDAQLDDFAVARSVYATDLKQYQGTRTFTAEIEAAPEPEPVLFECIICSERVDAHYSWQVPCEHYYCEGCLNELFRVAMNHEQAYPPRCCRQTVPFEDVRIFLNRDLAAGFGAKKEELDDTKPTYCHLPNCSTYIGQGNKSDDVATCPSCGAKTCVPCKHATHDGDCERDQAVEETMRL